VSDARLRELQKAWQETGEVSAEVAFVREALRLGHLTPVHLRAAAHLGHEVSREFLGPEDLPPEPEARESRTDIATRWASLLLELLQAFDSEEDGTGTRKRRARFFADLAERVAGSNSELSTKIGVAKAACLEGRAPDNADLLRILDLLTQSSVREELGDLSVVTRRLLELADYGSVGHAWHDSTTRQLAARGMVAVKRLVLGAPSPQDLELARRARERLETQRYETDSRWGSYLKGLTVLYVELADHELRDRHPEWGKWLRWTRSRVEPTGAESQVYFCACAEYLADVIQTASRLRDLESIQDCLADALLPLLLRRGQDPILETPLPWSSDPPGPE
jgi:hypothetical protein